MPDRGMAGRHLLRGHVGGVNWRPTRFAEVVPPWNVCGLCLVIPKRTVQLPCSHILCECCLGASRLEGVTMCPLDREPFEEDECHRIPIPARKANNLKAHCWNEEHGCEFVGTMEAVLRHYEEECTFQTIECRRCAERVLHKDLAVHYLGGCLPDTPSASTEQPSTQGSVLTVHDVSTALEDLKVLLKDPYHEQLPAIQSQINELVEHTRSEQAELLDIIALKLRDWERNMKDQVAQIVGDLCSTVAYQLQPVISELHGTSVSPYKDIVSEGGGSGSTVTRMSEKCMLRNLETLADMPLRAIEEFRCSVQPHPRRLSARCERLGTLEDIYQPVLRPSSYLLTLQNVELLRTPGKIPLGILAEVTFWHQRDMYIAIEFNMNQNSAARSKQRLVVDLRCYTLLETSLAPFRFQMQLLHECPDKNLQLSGKDPVLLTENGCSTELSQRGYLKNLNSLKCAGYLQNREIRFNLTIDETYTVSGTA